MENEMRKLMDTFKQKLTESENSNTSDVRSGKIQFMNEFYGIKILTNDSDVQKNITKISKKLGIFLLVNHSGVKYYIHEDKTQIEKFKKQIRSINENLNISDVRSSETIDARRIVINCLKMYDLTQVEEMNYQEDLANEIINDLVNAGFMK